MLPAIADQPRLKDKPQTKASNPRTSTPAGMNPARNAATKRPVASDEAPQQGLKRRKGTCGWRVTALSHDAGLLLPAALVTREDRHRNPAIKRAAEASPQQCAKVMKTSDTNVRGFQMPNVQRHQAVKRRASPSPEPRPQKIPAVAEKPPQGALNKKDSEDPAEERARHYLAHLGVRLLQKQTVEMMVSCSGQGVGDGAFGSCCKGVYKGKELVIKTFKEGLRSLISEAKCLQRLQGHGMQRLVGVCVETRQLVTRFAGQTAMDYFNEGACFTHALSVILQVAQAVRNVNQAGYTHNDIKDNNVCVKRGTRGPKATVIDLGLAKKIGKRGFYKVSKKGVAAKQRMYPWIAPELLRDSHPCSAASDVYSVAFFIRCVPGWQDWPVYSNAMRKFKEWVKRARKALPKQRPSLDELIEVVKELMTENASRTSALPNR